MSLDSVRPWRQISRRKSREISVGNVKIGGGNPISVQTMTNTITADAKQTIAQVKNCAELHFYKHKPDQAKNKPDHCHRWQGLAHKV